MAAPECETPNVPGVRPAAVVVGNTAALIVAIASAEDCASVPAPEMARRGLDVTSAETVPVDMSVGGSSRVSGGGSAAFPVPARSVIATTTAQAIAEPQLRRLALQGFRSMNPLLVAGPHNQWRQGRYEVMARLIYSLITPVDAEMQRCNTQSCRCSHVAVMSLQSLQLQYDNRRGR